MVLSRFVSEAFGAPRDRELGAVVRIDNIQNRKQIIQSAVIIRSLKMRVIQRAHAALARCAVCAVILVGFLCVPTARAQNITVSPDTMTRVATVDERFLSYNVEMLSVIGGKFWKPYSSQVGDDVAGATHEPDLYQSRPPLPLDNPRLRVLAAALGPAYVRVSGTWANTTYFPDTDDVPATPPQGFTGVLSHARWKALIAFADAANAEIVTSFANGAGTRDAEGAWTIDQAQRLLDFTRVAGGHIAAVEFMNEPTLAPLNVVKGYDAQAYGRDFKTFYAFVRRAAPDVLILGPDTIGGTDVGPPLLKARDLIAASRSHTVDVWSYHYYGALSQRCIETGMQTSAADALSESWLAGTDSMLAFNRALRDEFAATRPIWLVETADAACGGNPWAPTFIDTFRFLDQLGRLARQDVKVVMHNTLVWSDYGLLAEQTFAPRPNYWAALVWRKLMGPVVLDSGIAIREGLHLYAHCLRGSAGGVALLAINNSRTQETRLALPLPAQRYALSAPAIETAEIQLNGRPLALGPDDALPELKGEGVAAGPVTLAPASIAFFAMPQATNPSCR
jgi:heparanase